MVEKEPENLKLRVSIMNQVADRAPFALLINTVFAAVTAVFLSARLPGTALFYWWIAVVLSCVPPTIYLMVRQYIPFDQKNIEYFRAAHSFNSAISGLVWGLGMVYLCDLTSEYSVAVTFLTLAGFSTATISVMGEVPRSFFVAAGGALIPFGIYFFINTAYPERLLGFLPISILFVYTLIVLRISKGFYREAATFIENRAILDRLQSQKDRVQSINEQKSRFLAATSHDMAQPLEAQAAYIAALEKVLVTDEQRELLGKIETSRTNLDSMLDSLSEISRLDAQVIIPNLDRFAIAETVALIVDEFSNAARKKSIDISCDQEPWLVETDKMLITRIIRNVLSNAIKYSKRNGKVRINFERQGNKILLSIQDNGIGVSADQHDAIFEEYVQLARQRRGRSRGTGLGLSIVKRLSELLDIEMIFESKPGEGTRFVFSLPAADADSRSQTMVPAERSALRKSVLIISANRSTIDNLSMLLSDWRCEVYSALSVDEAVQLKKSLDIIPDVLILDLDLCDKVTLLHSIDEIRKHVSEKIRVLVTTEHDDENMPEALADDTIVLQKPVSEKKLHRLLSQV